MYVLTLISTMHCFIYSIRTVAVFIVSKYEILYEQCTVLLVSAY